MIRFDALPSNQSNEEEALERLGVFFMLVKEKPIAVPEILIPKSDINLSKWAVVACDQYTSQPEYWSSLKTHVADHPSTLNLVLPEVYLESMTPKMIDTINQNMNDYFQKGYFRSIGKSMVLVERQTILNQTRLGLMMNIDLESYDYHEGAKALIKATEKTIISRIPPRQKIRKYAPLEFTHVMLLVDDPSKGIIEDLYKNRKSFPKIYDFDLNMNGGHLRGYQISDCDDIIQKFYDLVDENHPFLFAVGDGNHSLATAKAHWENLKITLNKEDLEDHPARYALVEVVNIYDEGLQFEGIHRVLFNVKPEFLNGLFHAVDKDIESWAYTKETEKIPFFMPQSTAKAYEQIQTYIDEYMEIHKEVTIDYIHGEEEMMEICRRHPNSIGIRMPELQRSDLFPFIASGKVLPRKSFSMGCASAKRYYLESRMIVKHMQKREEK